MKRIVLVALLCLSSLPVWSQVKFVDMGLSVKWATCNVGASRPEQYGNYYTFEEASAINNAHGRCPTIAECTELWDNCKWTWTVQNGVKGMKVKSPKTGNSIFLPAAGDRRTYGSPASPGSLGHYWSSTANDSSISCSLYFHVGCVFQDYSVRSDGFSVRPVTEY